MNITKIFYLIKPYIPRRVQIAIRRLIASHKRKLTRTIWPISPTTAATPRGWSGWPNRKRFALILCHDVDTEKGHSRSIKLMDIERELGFRSSFNFVAEDYRVSQGLRERLVKEGFEVGVHGLKHNGNLFSSRGAFDRHAPRINAYLKDWGAVGFYSPAMYRNRDWIAELDIEYACSTFDTDPFEPQPNDVGTIFPLWIWNKEKAKGYIELPYTLPQDHCLFAILNEKDIRIWLEKLDWIAEKGGMARINTHPDYMNFDGTKCFFEEYPASYYRAFLEYIKGNYEGQYWHTLPRELARFWRDSMVSDSSPGPSGSSEEFNKKHRLPQQTQIIATPRVKIWVDFDNTPHVPFFIPIIRELERRGHKVVLTARNAFQVYELADKSGLQYTKIGHHYGKKPIMKIIGLLWRALQLFHFCLRQRPDLALSHGSRSQTLLCNLLRIPTVGITDYEYTRVTMLTNSRWLILPDALPGEGLHEKIDRIRHYRGIKEDVYAPEFEPDPSLLEELELRDSDIVITVRPPANEAHYHNPESDVMLIELMSRICQTAGIRAVLLPRNHKQEQTLRATQPDWFADARTIVPRHAVNGLNLLWYSDLVVSGGGTMNREAAALRVPVYSIFRGKTGAVDRMLEQEGRLTMIRSVEEVWTKILFVHRDKNRLPDKRPRPALLDIVNHIEDIIRTEHLLPHNQGKIGRSHA